MKIIISKSEVYKEVEKQSSIAASMLVGAESPKYEDVRVTEYDYEVLDTFWRDGVNSAIQIFTRYISNQTVSSDISTFDGTETLIISANMPDAFNDLLIGSITMGLKMMLACNVMAGWMGIKFPNSAQKYKDDALGYANDIKLKLLYRSVPAQNRSSDFKSDTTVTQDSDYFGTKGADTTIQTGEDYFAAKSAEIIVENESDYFNSKSADTDKEETSNYFQLKAADTVLEKDPDYFIDKSDDTIVDQADEYFIPKISDTIVEATNDYFSEKDNDVVDETGEDYFSAKSDDTTVNQSNDYFGGKDGDTIIEQGNDYLVVKDNDNLILEQYENCNNHP